MPEPEAEESVVSESAATIKASDFSPTPEVVEPATSETSLPSENLVNSVSVSDEISAGVEMSAILSPEDVTSPSDPSTTIEISQSVSQSQVETSPPSPSASDLVVDLTPTTAEQPSNNEIPTSPVNTFLLPASQLISPLPRAKVIQDDEAVLIDASEVEKSGDEWSEVEA